MPSISKTRLDEMVAAVEHAQAREAEWRRAAERAEERVRKFNTILEKIKKAASGLPLTAFREVGGSMGQSYGLISGEPLRKVKTEERQAQEIAALNDHVAMLRSRLAAVEAVTEFAQEHKA